MSRTAAVALSLVAAVTGCRSAPVIPGAKPDDCAIEFLERVPSRPYEELGELSYHVTNPPHAGSVQRPYEALRPGACRLGADAVVVTRNFVLNQLGHVLVEGMAIKYVEMAPPAPRPSAPDEGPPPARPGQAQDL